ncbi:MAG: hypothetical protein ACI3V4_12685 [Faecousia sp.]
MYKRIIYEKKYRHLIEEANSAEPQEARTSYADAEAFCQKIRNETVYIVLPERVENAPFFIELAKQTGEALQIDTSIVEYDNYISVTYALQKGVPYDGLKELIELVDEMSFQNDEHHVFISFDYYTCATYRAGQRVFPPE